MNDELRGQVRDWIAADPDPVTRAELENLLATDDAEVARRFAHPLSFGTAGLRGPEEAGPAGMNRLTVRRATQGVLAWLEAQGRDLSRGVVVGRDARMGSESFHDEVVSVLRTAGATVFDWPTPLPTPLVPFAVRELHAVAGVMITASHNPPRDNGYKLYDADGSQINAPHDAVVEATMRAAGPLTIAATPGEVRTLGDDLLSRYTDELVARFRCDHGVTLAYTPLHGVGGALTTRLLEECGHRVIATPAQFEPDGRFPTVAFPNPEEQGALDLVCAAADAAGADLILANDPDADRLGVAVRDSGKWRILRGDEIGWLLGAAALESARPGDVVATSLVSSTLLATMAEAAGVPCVITPTGFKWIGRAGAPARLCFGYEEALGYAVDSRVGDKDGVSAALAMAHLAAQLAGEGRTLLDRLDEIAERYGVVGVENVTIRLEGHDALTRIAATMAALRDAPPTSLGGRAVVGPVDLRQGWRDVAPLDGVLWPLEGGGRVLVRPSGTEPKVKAYLEVIDGGDGTLAERRRRVEAAGAAVAADVRALLG